MGVWKVIRNRWEPFEIRTHFKVDSRNMIKFWKDRWCEDSLLKDTFLDLYAIASSKEAWMML